jgi:hypothetical protein
LLFTVAPDCIDVLCKGWMSRFGTDLFHIGRISNETEVLKMCSAGGEIRMLGSKAHEHFTDLEDHG